METQIAATRPLAKRLWKVIVVAKIRRQAWALKQTIGVDGGLGRLASQVRAGDPDNVEAQAARRYWPLLFGEKFRRNRTADGINSLLNYGYTILRSATARALAAAGLHPGLGIFHRHPHNPMPLVDDLMEPFRPIIDVEVYGLLVAGTTAVTPEAKRTLVATLSRTERTASGNSPLSTCLFRLTKSLAESYGSGNPLLDLPLLSDLSLDVGQE